MSGHHLMMQIRQRSGLTQRALAVLSGTSRPTLSAYEHGRKSPTLSTAQRIATAAGVKLSITAPLAFVEIADSHRRPITVPTTLPRLDVDRAFAQVELPLHLNWSDVGRRFDLRYRRQRARVYEIVLREGGPDDIVRYIDGALLADLWSEIVVPEAVRRGWQPLMPASVEKFAA